VSRRAGQQATIDGKLEQGVTGCRRWDREKGPLGNELVAQRTPQLALVDQRGATRQIKSVLIVGPREGMQRETTIPAEVDLFGGRDDERIDTNVRQQGTDRVQPRASVRPHGCKEGETNAELVEQVTAGLGQVGTGR
jgi:hypothetical protein